MKLLRNLAINGFYKEHFKFYEKFTLIAKKLDVLQKKLWISNLNFLQKGELIRMSRLKFPSKSHEFSTFNRYLLISPHQIRY